MLEKTISEKARNAIKAIERELNRPLSIPFGVLVYLKRRKERSLPTAAEDSI